MRAAAAFNDKYHIQIHNVQNLCVWNCMDVYYPEVFASKEARKSLVVITSLCSVYMLLLKLFVQAQLVMLHSAPLVQGQRAIWRLP